MPLMIGSDAAFSLPCSGSSMAIVTVPFELSPAGAGVLGVSAALLAPALAPALAAGLLPPPPVLAAGDGVPPPVLLHAANARTATPASALTLRNFIHCPPHQRSAGDPPRPISVGASATPSAPVPARVARCPGPDPRVGRPPDLREVGSTDSWSSGGAVTDDGAGSRLGRRAGCRRSDAVS